MTWKNRCVSLIVCFALIVSITVVRPPKAEAIAFEAGIAVPIILAVAIASGITFLSEGMTETGLTQYIGQQLQQYATDIGTTVSEWWDGIGSISKRDNGQVVISSPTYQAVQNFLDWYKTSQNVSSVPVVAYSNSGGMLLANGSIVTVDTAWNGEYKTAPTNLRYFLTGLDDLTISFASGSTFIADSSGVDFKKPNGDNLFATTRRADCSYFFYVNGSRICLGYKITSWSGCSVGADVTDYVTTAGASSLSVSQPASYDALELQDEESVALDLGATVDAGATLEDILAEYLAKIVDNTATASQEVTTESGEGEGDDDDTAPYLPFIPRIWEKLQGLPDDIADKVHDLFVPSAAFVEALPAEFADVFDSRCGLLTYPAALLADFLTRLATLTAQEPVLRWGNIKEPFSDRQLIAAGSYNLNSAIQTEAMQTVYNVYMICVKAAVAFWFVELCKRKYEKIIRS